jgi:hypothetical protein
MRQWPCEIRVELRSTDGSAVDHLLIGLTVRHHGRSYYNTLLGLSDPDGVLVVDGASLAADHLAAQHLFPMDYRLPPADWDEHAIVSLADGRDFEARRRCALESPMLSPAARELWSAARNTGLAAATGPVALDGRSATVALPVRRVGFP